ncbi:hypothetical protein Ae201684_005753 [Aphanomyces euteiches]|uniref:Uncharacterized protein n=1 Tax=Aphanomyces euteiches TaxID=100861 RepID=A0A6G0XDU4_9STRA|nr:hypothetical protein Ae201684_005753 [Aphanomyces euteiches]
MDAFSPKHCKLIAQIWEISSVNVLMLLKVCKASVQEKLQVQDDLARYSQFSQNCAADQTDQFKTLSASVEGLKSELRLAKAEIQTLQRKLKRTGLEKDRLAEIFDQVTTVGDTDPPEDILNDDEGDESWPSEILQYQQATPWEITLDDLDKLYCAVESENENQLATLGQLDRYIESSLVSLLWKHQATGPHSRFVKKMFSVETKETQTDESVIVANSKSQDDLMCPSSPGRRHKALGIPQCIRSLLDSVPKVDKLLTKQSLRHLILSMSYLRKADMERTKPNRSLAVFIRDLFVHKFGLKSLADYHMIELVKSCIYFHRKCEQEMDLLGVSIDNLTWDDGRIELFGRLLSIFAETNRPNESLDIMLDFITDVFEIDNSFPSLQHIQEIDGPVLLSRDLVVFVWKAQFGYMDSDAVENAIYSLNERNHAEDADYIDMDWVLSFVVQQWNEYEDKLDQALREAFRTILTASSTSRTNLLLQMDGFVTAVQIVWADAIEADIQHLYMNMMATKRDNFRLASDRRRKDRLRAGHTTHVAATTVLGIDGVFEEEFVTHVGAAMRARRVHWGIRTRGQLLWHEAKGIWLGGQGRSAPMGFQESTLKPGIKP